jgi:DNA-binding transcriptional regulator YiaG
MTDIRADECTLDDCIAEFEKEDPGFRAKLEQATQDLDAGHEIYLLRKTHNLSRKRFGQILGVSEKDVLSLEYGDFRSAPENAFQWACEKVQAWRSAKTKPPRLQRAPPIQADQSSLTSAVTGPETQRRRNL